MMEREIDRHESRRTRNLPRSRVNMWREAWTRCHRVVEHWDRADTTKFHLAFEHWVPILNRVFGRPIRSLEKYQMSMYYCDEPMGPKEIVHLYMDENTSPEGRQSLFVIFNSANFRTLRDRYCNDFTRSNRMLVDEARGTINMSLSSGQPAEYFRNSTTWQLLFIFTCHAMAHLDAFDNYDHAYYDNHAHVRESVFYKMHFYGQIVHDV